MGQPVLPRWLKEGNTRCIAKIGKQRYSASITQELENGFFKVKIAIPNTLSGGLIIRDYEKPVSFKNLVMREKRIPELDETAA